LPKDPRFYLLKNFQSPEVVGMLVSFPTNVHEFQSVKHIPSYGRFSEKGSKTSKIRKLPRLFTWPLFRPNFQKF